MKEYHEIVRRLPAAILPEYTMVKTQDLDGVILAALKTLDQDAPEYFELVTKAASARGLELLALAAYYNSTDLVKYLILKGIKPSSKTLKGPSPLNTAIYFEHIKIIDVLIQQGANLNHTDGTGQTPLVFAAVLGRTDCINFLLEKKATEKKAIVNAKDANGVTALLAAIQHNHLDVVQLLLTKGADPNIADPYGVTPLCKAIMQDNGYMVEVLISNGANVNQIDPHYNVPLMTLAITADKYNTINALQKAGATFQPPTTTTIATPTYVKAPGSDIMEFLHSLTPAPVYPPDTKLTPDSAISTTAVPAPTSQLFETIAQNNIEEVKKASEGSSDDESFDDKGKGEADPISSEDDSSDDETLSHDGKGKDEVDPISSKGNSTAPNAGSPTTLTADTRLTEQLFDAIINDNITKIKESLNAGAKINEPRSFKKGFKNYTPLMYAAFKGKLEIVKLLVKNGADLNAIDYYNNNTLHHLIRSEADNEVKVAITNFLIEQGIDTNLKGQYGQTALDYAAEKDSDVLEILKHTKQLTNLLFKAIEHNDLKNVKELLKKGAKINQSRSFKKDTPLMCAAFKGKLKMVKLLVEKGANVNAIDHHNNNALHHLMSSKAGNKVKVAITKFLIKQGIDTNLIGRYGKTALDHAKKGSKVWEILKHAEEKLLKESMETKTASDDSSDTSSKHSEAAVTTKAPSDHHASYARIARTPSKKISPKQISTSKASTNAGSPTTLTADTELTEQLFEAIKKNNFTKLQQALKAGANTETPFGPKNDTALTYAADKCKLGMVKLLIQHGTNINAVDNDGNNALHKAVKTLTVTSRYMQQQIIEVLIEHHINTEVKNHNNETALDHAKKGSKVWEILKNAEEKQLKESKGAKTASAVSIDAEESLSHNHKGEPDETITPKSNATDNSDEHSATTTTTLSSDEATPTPVVSPSNTELEKTSKKATESSKNKTSKQSKKSTHQAAQKLAFIKAQALTGQLFKAIHEGDLKGIEKALQDGADLNLCLGSNRDTPLIYAVSNGKLEIVKLLVEKGADVNATDSCKNNTLHKVIKLTDATEEEKIEIVKLLLIKGINVLKLDITDKTALHHAEKDSKVWKILKDAEEKQLKESKETKTVSAVSVDAEETQNDKGEQDETITPKSNATDTSDEHSATATTTLSSDEATPTPVVSPSNTELEKTSKKAIDPNQQDVADNTKLFKAVQAGDVEKVKSLVELGAEVNFTNAKNGSFALLNAVKKQHHEIVEYLLTTGKALANSADSKGITPLIMAIQNDDKKSVDLLLNNGAAANYCTDNPETPYALAAAIKANKLELVQKLIDRGADKEIVDSHGWTPLMYASKFGNQAIVKYLVDEQKVNLQTTNSKGMTAFQIAIEFKQYKTTEYLLHKGDVLKRGESGKWCPVAIAAKNNDTKTLQLLLKKEFVIDVSFEGGPTGLTAAIADNKLKAAKYLLEQGANPKQVDKQGNTPLALAVSNKNKQLIKLLLEKGAVTTIEEINKLPPISGNKKQDKAIRKLLEDNREALQKLAAATAEAEAKDKQKLKAKQSETPKTKTKTKALEKKFANNKDTGMFGPKYKQRVLEEAITKGMPKSQAFLSAIILGQQQALKAFIENEKKEKGHFDVNTKIATPLDGKLPPILIALEYDNIQAAKLLLEYGANVNCEATIDGTKKSPLGYAVTEGNIELAKIFITHHAKVDFICRKGYTLLIEAVLKNQTDMVKLLIDNGADINHIDNSNETALTKAISTNNIEIIKILLEKGAKTVIKKDGKLISVVDFSDDSPKYKEVKSIIVKHINDRAKIIEANKQAKKKAAETKISEIEEPKPESENKVAETPKETPVFSPKPIEPPKLSASAWADIVEIAEAAGLMEYDYSGGE